MKNSERFGGNREKVLERDNYSCQKCGMTNAEHIKKWNRSITIDHIDRNGRFSKYKNNDMSNLMTLCIKCHGIKDRCSPARSPLTPEKVIEMRRLREQGVMVKDLAEQYKVSTRTIYDTVHRNYWKHI